LPEVNDKRGFRPPAKKTPRTPKGFVMSPQQHSNIDELLGDRLIQAVMRADRVDPLALRSLLGGAASRIAARRPVPAKPATTFFTAPRIAWTPSSDRAGAPLIPLPAPSADACFAGLCG
jgi:hypothetical protein